MIVFLSFAVRNIISLLSANDLISLIIVSNEAETMLFSNESNEHNLDGVMLATQEAKEELLELLYSLELSRSITNHSMAFEYAFKKIYNSEKAAIINTKQQPVQFVYVTRGLIGNLTETENILSVIANRQNELKQPIMINIGVVVFGKYILSYILYFVPLSLLLKILFKIFWF